MVCLTKIKTKLVTLIFLSMQLAGCAQTDIKNSIVTEEVPALSPKATVSLEYPNRYDFNKLIALSNDGRYLLDAAVKARYIRVWDWKKKEVVQRLLSNEYAPEQDDGKDHERILDNLSYERNITLSPDGSMAAACIKLSTPPRTAWTSTKARIWNLESGAVVANIYAQVRNVAGIDPGTVLSSKCDSISFSPDGKYMAITDGSAVLVNEADVLANIKISKWINITGITLYETKNWQLLRFAPVPEIKPQQETKKQKISSRVLFSGDSKQVLGAVFDIPPLSPRGRYDGEWVGSRLVRWDVVSGAMLGEENTPKIGRPESGVWWYWLPGGQEVWWETYDGDNMQRQSKNEALHCEAAVTTPAFTSDVAENCAYKWAIAVMNINTGKIKYLAPFRKNTPEISFENRTHFRAVISPDGAHLVLRRSMAGDPKRSLQDRSSVELIDMRTQKNKAAYSWEGIAESPVFSGDSKYFAIKTQRAKWFGAVDISALIFEIPEPK